MGRPYRKKSAREHQAAVELASKRRQLAKLLKKEGFDGVPLDKKPKPVAEDKPEDESNKEQVPKSREEREKERAEKVADRKRRAATLLKRTAKGQPVMKNLMGDLVSKLTKSL